jgi:hypothetical protein
MQHVGTSYNLSPLLAFYAFEFPLFYNHRNHDGNVMIIPFAMGTHQNDHLGRALFALTHLRALCSMISHFPLVYFHTLQMTLTSLAPLPLYNLHMNILD